MSRFVVLQHDPAAGSPEPVHWDLMLEQEGVLLTWALTLPPDAGGVVTARKLPDHRLEYLDYEGEISGGRGSVTRWDRGTCALEEVHDERVVVRLDGARLRGEARLERGESEPAWQYRFTPESRR